jgi:predicted PurR-regulated permease PerM
MNAAAPTASPATRNIIVAIALVALAVMIWRTADVFIVAFGGVVVAALLRALALPLARRLHWSERWTVLAVLAALVVGFVLLGWLFGNLATKQATQLQEQLPKAGKKFLEWLQQWQLGQQLIDTAKQTAGDSKSLSHLGVAATAVFGGVADLLLVLFLGVYFAIDPRMYRDGVLRLLPPVHRGRVGRALDDAGDALRRWLLGQLVAMISVGVLVGIGLALVGVPLAPALGVVAAIFEFIPVIGPILFSIPGLLLAFAKGPNVAVYALIVYVVVQQVESNVLIPLLQRWAVELPPVVGLLAIVAGAYLLGVMGVVFATPAAVVIMALVQHLYVEEALEQRPPRSPPRRRATTQ